MLHPGKGVVDSGSDESHTSVGEVAEGLPIGAEGGEEKEGEEEKEGAFDHPNDLNYYKWLLN